MAYIKLYKAADNSEISGAGTYTNDVEFTLRADQNETGEVRLYAMADSGYSIATTEVIPSGTSAAKWALAPDNAGSAGTYGTAGAKVSLGTVTNGAGKVYFWAKASATSDETPVNDTSVTLVASGVASAV